MRDRTGAYIVTTQADFSALGPYTVSLCGPLRISAFSAFKGLFNGSLSAQSHQVQNASFIQPVPVPQLSPSQFRSKLNKWLDRLSLVTKPRYPDYSSIHGRGTNGEESSQPREHGEQLRNDSSSSSLNQRSHQAKDSMLCYGVPNNAANNLRIVAAQEIPYALVQQPVFVGEHR